MKILVIAVLSAVCLAAQQPQVENAKLETRAFAGSLAVSAFGAFQRWPWLLLGGMVGANDSRTARRHVLVERQ